MYAEADLDYFRSLGDELLSVASGSPDSDSFDDAAFYFIDEYYYICTAHDLANLRYYRDPSDQEAPGRTRPPRSGRPRRSSRRRRRCGSREWSGPSGPP